MKFVLITLGVVVGPLLAFAVAMLLLIQIDCRHPSDASLAKRFYKHEAEFQELAAMARTDSRVGRIAPTFTRPENPTAFSEDRWNDYRSRFRRLGLDLGIMTGDDSIWFLASGIGLLNRGSKKGYIYSLKPLAPCVPDLEKRRPDLPRYYIVYKPLKQHWYLFL